jgi:Alanine dehydrogenase/PNT, N-terminal domain
MRARVVYKGPTPKGSRQLARSLNLTKTIGIRREDKNVWERRVPIIPEHLERILEADDLAAVVQSYPERVFSDEAYRRAGAEVAEDLSACDLVLAVKEIPTALFAPGGAYVFFSHTIKAQPYNMAMLGRLLELGCTLFDYERITDDQGRRLVFFSRQAGQAGMLDTLHLLGARLAAEGFDTPLSDVKMAYSYASLDEAKAALADVGARIKDHGQGMGLPEALSPLVVGFAGYGNVSQGAQDVFDVLPATTVTPEALESGEIPADGLVKVVFAESDMVEPLAAGATFELQEYYQHPERYRGRFARFLPRLHVLLNGIYWEDRYPRLVTNADLRSLWEASPQPLLRVLGDVSCDIDGSIQCTIKSTMPDAPSYVFDPLTGEHTMGFEGRGPVIMAVDNLPAEMSHESSVHFSESLWGLVADVVRADRSVRWEDYDVPAPMRRAVIAYNGELTPDYAYLQKSL